MTPRRGHDAPALAAAGVGAAAAFLAGAAGVGASAVALAALLVGFGRGRGWGIARALDRPRLFAVLGAVYAPVFVLDLLLSLRAGSPVAALVRMVVFLLSAEVLSGDPPRAHRPILFGLLLLMAAAAATTEFWFVLPLAAFCLTAAAAQIRATLLEAQPPGAAPHPPRVPLLRGALPIALGSLALGAVFFFVIPRAGAGWGPRASTTDESATIETGLAEQVSLGTVGKVKRSSTIAFRARLDAAGHGAGIDPESIYWRAHTYSRWTGAGWSQQQSEPITVLALPAGELVAIAGRNEERPEPTLVAEIERVRIPGGSLPSPGVPIWLRAPRSAVALMAPDGTLLGARGATPRLYTVAVRVEEASPEALRSVAVAPGEGDPARNRAGDSHGDRAGDAAEGPAGSQEDRADDAAEGPAGSQEDRAGGRGGEIANGPVEDRARDRARALDRPGDEDPLRAFTQTGRQDADVVAWADRVAPDAGSRYDLARAFVKDLASRRYSLDTTAIDTARPIASFLAGAPAHCEYFASAMVLGLRLRDVPSRVVGGWLGADSVPFGRDLLVRDARAHLWVEVYFDGAGWVPFDPTPEGGRFLSIGALPRMRAAWDRAVLAWDSWIIGLDLGDQVGLFLRIRDDLRALARAAIDAGPAPAAALLGSLALLAWLAWLFRKWRARERNLSGVPSFYRSLLALAARHGVQPKPAETAGEFAYRAGWALGDVDAARALSRLYERVRFGGRALSEEDLSSGHAAIHRLTQR